MASVSIVNLNKSMLACLVTERLGNVASVVSNNQIMINDVFVFVCVCVFVRACCANFPVASVQCTVDKHLIMLIICVWRRGTVIYLHN